MSDLPRPRRSALYMPGANERALAKAATLPADVLLLDLEDAVAPDAKPAARDRVCAAAGSGDYPDHEVVIRANAIGTPWHADDLAAIARSGAAAALVPKVSSADDVAGIVAALDDAGAPPSLAVWAMVETPRGILRVEEIAAAERVAVLVMGTNDLANELGAQPGTDRGPLLPALSTCVLAARAYGKTVLDGVFNAIRDDEGFAAEAAQGRALGFDGKTLIHPSQVDPCNAAFTPSAEEYDHAQRVIEAFESAERDGSGVATVDGKMIENLHARHARWVVALRDATAAKG